jgi:uncharacterized BrkB/YihY/UPF0761 family membrane protein
MTEIQTSTDPKPGIRGVLIFILTILFVRVIVGLYFFLLTLVGDAENYGVTAFFELDEPQKIYVLYGLFTALILLLLNVYLLFLFSKKKKEFVTVFLATILIGLFLQIIDLAFLKLLFDQNPMRGPRGLAGLGVFIGIIQYMFNSPRARVTFVN